MKKLFGLFVLALALNSCDDGDLTIENIDFSTVSAARCNDIVYKLKDTEALFFEVADHDAVFANDATLPNTPRVVQLNASNRIFYRAYNGEIASANICETVQPATPTVSEEWTFTGGTIEVTTTPVIIDNTELAGGQLIQRYRHNVVFRNVYKNTPDGTEFLETYVFGDYFTMPNTLPFNFDGSLEKCGNMVTSVSGSEAFSLNIDPALIENVTTAAGQPRVGLLGATTNQLTYSLFQSAVTDAYFCTSPAATPVLIEQWTGDAGVQNVSGIIEVTTTSSGPGVFEHEIHLKNVTLRKGNSAFLLASDYLLGTLTTS